MRDADPLHKAIRALEGQRALLGDAVVNTALAPLREQLAQLESALPRSGEQVLKQVSVLFLDVVGSTTLAQQLDPEEVSDVMDGCLQRCTEVVLAHGGKVLQYAGDSLLAAFGAETAREDDAERAVRAGLALLALGRRVGDEVRARHDHAGFDVRVGVHTGSVLLGGGVDEGGTIRGIAVNIAARMEQTAPAGALRISHDSYALVRGIFDVQAQAPLLYQHLQQQAADFNQPIPQSEWLTIEVCGNDARHVIFLAHGCTSFCEVHDAGQWLLTHREAAEAALRQLQEKRILLAMSQGGYSRIHDDLDRAFQRILSELRRQQNWRRDRATVTVAVSPAPQPSGQ